MRIGVRVWWRSYPKRSLLTHLYRRAARRRDKLGSPDSRRPPTYAEGLEVARALLANFPRVGPLDPEAEAEIVSLIMAIQWRLPIGAQPSRQVLRHCQKLARRSRVYFDALTPLLWNTGQGRQAHRHALAVVAIGSWWAPSAVPHCKPIPARRPANPNQLWRDVQIQFIIEILDRVGIRPRGYLRFRLPDCGRGGGASRGHSSARLEGVSLENVSPPRHVQILGGHRPTHRTLSHQVLI